MLKMGNSSSFKYSARTYLICGWDHLDEVLDKCLASCGSGRATCGNFAANSHFQTLTLTLSHSHFAANCQRF